MVNPTISIIERWLNSIPEPVFRLAEKEWKAFVEEFTTLLTQTDPQIPVLPPNDVIHRIYRDIRFSNDKTPYKLGPGKGSESHVRTSSPS